MAGTLYAAVTALSHDGLVRDSNEDSVVAGSWTVCAATTLTPQTLYFPVGDPVVVAVADGLGGHPAGEQASSLVVRRLAWLAPRLTDGAAVREALLECNEEVYAEAALDSERFAMGSTVAGIVIGEAAVIVFNVGDSRVYRFTNAGLVRLTVDDSEPPGPGQRRSATLTQALGGGLPAGPIDPHVETTPLTGPARYLVCTDGLTDAVDDATITNVLRAHEGGRAAFELWQAAIDAGAPDNVTLALVEIADQDPS